MAGLAEVRPGGPETGGRAARRQAGPARHSGGQPKNRPTDRSDCGRTGHWAPRRGRPTGPPAAAGVSHRAARASRSLPSWMERRALARPRRNPLARGQAAQGLALRDAALPDAALRGRPAPEPGPGWPREQTVRNSRGQARDRAAPGAGCPGWRGTDRARQDDPERRPPARIRLPLPPPRRRRPSGPVPPPRHRCRAPGPTRRCLAAEGSVVARSCAHRHRPLPRPRYARGRPARSGCRRGCLPRAARSRPGRHHPRRARHPRRSRPPRRHRPRQPPSRRRRLRRCRRPRQALPPAQDCAAPTGRHGRRRNQERRRPRRLACSGAGPCGSAACRSRRARSNPSCRSQRPRTGAGTAFGR
jgi:hypothetical protein